MLTAIRELSSFKLARGGLSDRRALPPVAERATDKMGFFSDAVPGTRPMVVNVSPPVCPLMARNVYGLAATAAPLEYILYRLVGVAAAGLLSECSSPPVLRMEATSSAQYARNRV